PATGGQPLLGHPEPGAPDGTGRAGAPRAARSPRAYPGGGGAARTAGVGLALAAVRHARVRGRGRVAVQPHGGAAAVPARAGVLVIGHKRKRAAPGCHAYYVITPSTRRP